ncbi:helicase-related protein [Mollicutes bacterium LVI A0039]|nr:helicase-related protein [Mollicutes bacterium LVI A0039]
MDFKLTMLQFAASRFLINNYNHRIDGVVVAVCGAGKTEMCFPLIEKIYTTAKIAFAIPRIDICLDIYERLKIAFGANVGIHTGNLQQNLTANILVLTTNQLLKYRSYFNLIIIDEVDAFPFDVDPTFYLGVLACLNVGSIFYLTSTPSSRLEAQNLPTFTIYKRWHNLPLPVPQMIHYSSYIPLPRKLKKIIANRDRQLLIFIATINKGQDLSEHLSSLNIVHQFVYSSHPNRTEIIQRFRQNEFTILLTTTILERGVTFKDIDVLVIDSDDSFYNKAALVQIAGRARRHIDYQDASVYFGYKHYTTTIKAAISFISSNNRLIGK